MNYDEILANLEKAGVEVNSKGFFKKGTKQQANDIANAILAVAGVNKDMFLAEYGKRLQEKLKQLAGESNENSMSDDYHTIVLQHKLLTDIDAFGEPDRLIFQKIKFAQNPLDGSIVLLLNVHGASWKGIPLSGNGTTERIQFTAACGITDPVHPNLFKNYYEEMEAYTTKPLRKAIADYRTRKMNDELGLVTEIIDKVPHSMIRNSVIKVLCKKKKITLGEDKNEIVWIPQTGGMFVGADSSQRYDVFNHIITKAPALAALPEMRTAMPVTLSNNPETPALNYIDLNSITKEGPCPTWDEFSERFRPDDMDVIKAFIWSIFRADNKGRQLLYIFDPDGFSGKSVMLSVLFRYLGENMCAALQKDSLNNQFSLAKVWDKRLVTIDDNKNKNLIRSEKMHMMLGGGRADIEMKGRNSFSSRLNMKIIAMGNIPLEIDPHAVHERTRLIMIRPYMTDRIFKRFCLLDDKGELIRRNGHPVPMGDPSFEERLYAEFPMFLEKCKEAYARLCPTNANITLNESQIDYLYTLSPDTDIILDAIVDKYFDIGEDKSMKPIDLQKQFYDARKKVGFGIDSSETITFDDFKTYLSKRYSFTGISRARAVPGRPRMFMGIAPKEAESKPWELRRRELGGMV